MGLISEKARSPVPRGRASSDQCARGERSFENLHRVLARRNGLPDPLPGAPTGERQGRFVRSRAVSDQSSEVYLRKSERGPW